MPDFLGPRILHKYPITGQPLSVPAREVSVRTTASPWCALKIFNFVFVSPVRRRGRAHAPRPLGVSENTWPRAGTRGGVYGPVTVRLRETAPPSAFQMEGGIQVLWPPGIPRDPRASPLDPKWILGGHAKWSHEYPKKVTSPASKG